MAELGHERRLDVAAPAMLENIKSLIGMWWCGSGENSTLPPKHAHTPVFSLYLWLDFSTKILCTKWSLLCCAHARGMPTMWSVFPKIKYFQLQKFSVLWYVEMRRGAVWMICSLFFPFFIRSFQPGSKSCFGCDSGGIWVPPWGGGILPSPPASVPLWDCHLCQYPRIQVSVLPGHYTIVTWLVDRCGSSDDQECMFAFPINALIKMQSEVCPCISTPADLDSPV